VIELMDRLGACDIAYTDAANIIESEYRSVVDPDWFEAWYFERLQSGDILIRERKVCAELIKTLVSHYGFPRQSRDRHYIELCCGLVEAHMEETCLISEDLDFFDPAAKGDSSKRRLKLLKSGSGHVARHLKKKERVLVRCVESHTAAT
jgi:hypothetical protein